MHLLKHCSWHCLHQSPVCSYSVKVPQSLHSLDRQQIKMSHFRGGFTGPKICIDAISLRIQCGNNKAEKQHAYLSVLIKTVPLSVFLLLHKVGVSFPDTTGQFWEDSDRWQSQKQAAYRDFCGENVQDGVVGGAVNFYEGWWGGRVLVWCYCKCRNSKQTNLLTFYLSVHPTLHVSL